MACKRKSSDEEPPLSRKRSRASTFLFNRRHHLVANISQGSATDSPPYVDVHSDDSEDYKVNFTDNGTRRAESEARRQWNYICTVEGCHQRFNRPCRLEAHIRSHNKERPFACSAPGCDKTFPRKDHLQRHLKNAHSDPGLERTYICDWPGCDKSFTSNGRLQRHRDVHDSKFYCTAYPPCHEAFRKEKALIAHVKSQHEEVKPYQCTFVDSETGEACTSGYQTESALHRHVYKKHPVDKENGIFCMLCTEPEMGDEATDIPKMPIGFATQKELQEHISQYHPPICSECGQHFKTDSTLKSHYDTVHADPAHQPRFPCPKPDCDSVFNRKHNLAIHIQTVHEKQSRYFCTSDALRDSKHDDLKAWNGENACGAAFKAKSSLDQHVRTHHLGLGTRKQLRKAAKSKKKPEASMLSMLTGVGYDKTREVPCLVKPCDYRFYMDRDLRRHLHAAHNLPDDAIEELIAERDALSGGQFWIGGLDESDTFSSMGLFDSADPSMPQTPIAPYYVEGAMPPPPPLMMPHNPADPSKTLNEAQFPFFNDEKFQDLALLQEDEELDLQMGLGDLAPASDVMDGLLGFDMLAPVGQFNLEHE